MTDAANRQKSRTRLGRGDTNERHAIAYAQTWKYGIFIAGAIIARLDPIAHHIIRPFNQAAIQSPINISIMISGDDGHLKCGTKGFQHFLGFGIFGRQTQVSQVPGNNDMIGLGGQDVIDHAGQNEVMVLRLAF